MDSTEDAAVDMIPIGPSTFFGRAVAIRVLTCNILRQIIILLKNKMTGKLATFRKLMHPLWRYLWLWINPRSPHFLLGSVLLAAWLLRRVRLRSMKEEMAYRRNFWVGLMKTAVTYDEWAHAASMLEKYQGRKRDSDLYDEDLLRAKLEDLKQRRLEGGVEDIIFALRTDLLRNLGNMCNPELHKGRLQTPKLIHEYINEVRFHLRAVCDSDADEFPLEEKLAFIHETRHAYGRTAILLSGGAALGAFHLGVVRTLIEHRVFPRVLAGASVGSVICSFAATRTWTELQAFFDDLMPPMHFFESMGSIFATAHRLLTRGAIAEIGLLQRQMRQLIGDLTFQEAYELSGRVLGITVCSLRPQEPHRMLNYLTSPHVVIWSAVTASCAFPGLFEAQELMAKDRHGRLIPYHMPTETGPEKPCPIRNRTWRDGSLESDLPMRELKEMFNVNHFIVSQANPHIAPLLRLKEACRAYGGNWAAKAAELVEMEVKHRCKQALTMGLRLGGLAKLFSQDWEGDITIVMPATLAQFAKLIQNPTPSELRKAVMQGRRCTWEKMSAIQANCGIELMLDECVSALNHRRKLVSAAATSSGFRPPPEFSGQPAEGSVSRNARLSGTKRILSWNCLARESSWGSLDEDGLAGSAQEGSFHGGGVHPGGPWAAPLTSWQRRRAGGGRGGVGGGGNHDGSDSDSGTEGLEQGMVSWTRAGGPFMRSPSAVKLGQQPAPEIGAEEVDGKALKEGGRQGSIGEADQSQREETEGVTINGTLGLRHAVQDLHRHPQQSFRPNAPLMAPASHRVFWGFQGRFFPSQSLFLSSTIPPTTGHLPGSYPTSPHTDDRNPPFQRQLSPSLSTVSSMPHVGIIKPGEAQEIEEVEAEGRLLGLAMGRSMYSTSSNIVDALSIPHVGGNIYETSSLRTAGGSGSMSHGSDEDGGTRRGGHKPGCKRKASGTSSECHCWQMVQESQVKETEQNVESLEEKGGALEGGVKELEVVASHETGNESNKDPKDGIEGPERMRNKEKADLERRLRDILDSRNVGDMELEDEEKGVVHQQKSDSELSENSRAFGSFVSRESSQAEDMHGST